MSFFIPMFCRPVTRLSNHAFSIPTHLRKRFFSLSYNVVEGSSSLKESPLLIAHGLMGSKSNFRTISKKLNEKTGRMVITYDARNHGDSKHFDSMTLPEMCDDVLQLLNKLSVKKCVFIGHSMGARVAMYTALSNPGCIDKLVVVDASPCASNKAGGSSLHYTKAMEKVVWDRNNSLSVARKHADWQLPKDIDDVVIRNFLLTNVIEVKPGQYGWRLNLKAIREHVQNYRGIELTADMSPYTAPSLFIGGGNSNFITPDDYPSIKKLFPSSQITHIPKCGHWVHSEKPDEFMKKLLGFLKPEEISLF